MQVENTSILSSQASKEEQILFYNGLWAGRSIRPNPHEIRRLTKILRAMTVAWGQLGESPFEICDLGCGVGWLANELSRFGSVTGVDFSPEGIRVAQQRWPNISFEVADVVAYRPNRKFDIVVSSEVLEHVDDQGGFFRTVDYLLKPGGILVLTCPNGKVRRFHCGLEQPIEKWPTPKQLRELAQAHLTICYQSTFILDFSNSGPLRIINSVKLRKLLAWLGLEHTFHTACRSLGYGLYHIVYARKPQSPSQGN